jgi:hypothetical protein
LLFNEELKDLKEVMKDNDAQTIQEVMGEETTVKKIHTREMSRLFKSKKEIY